MEGESEHKKHTQSTADVKQKAFVAGCWSSFRVYSATAMRVNCQALQLAPSVLVDQLHHDRGDLDFTFSADKNNMQIDQNIDIDNKY